MLVCVGHANASSRWPHEAASCQQMQMDVEYRLTGFAIGVEYRPVAAVRVSVFFRDLRGSAVHRSDEDIVSRGQVVQRSDVAPGDDQHMQWRLRVDVLDGDQLIVLVHELSRDLAANDLAEETITHDARRPRRRKPALYTRSITAVRGIPCRSARIRSRRSDGRASTRRRTSFS